MKNNEGSFSCFSINDSLEEISVSNVPLAPFFSIIQNGDYEAAGVGLRQNNTGSITISLPTDSVITNAFLYWESLENNSTLSDTGSLNGNSIVGTLIASSTVLCWDRKATHYFRADVTGMATEGNNVVEILPGGDETFLEGASLVIIFSNPTFTTKQISINDGGVALNGNPLSEASTIFTGFIVSDSPIAKTTYIVGDGQTFEEDLVPDFALFNGNEVAGPNAFFGADGEFWDTLTIDVSHLVAPGDTSATAEITTGNDCLGWIAQVFSVTVQETCPTCDNTLDFAVDILIPRPLIFLHLGSEAIDPSCLQCCIETCEITAAVSNPCGGSPLICPVEINSIRAFGNANVYINILAMNPNNQQTISFLGQTTVCVDNVLCYRYTTDDSSPCTEEFFNLTSIGVNAISTTSTPAGNTLVSVSGRITLPTC